LGPFRFAGERGHYNAQRGEVSSLARGCIFHVNGEQHFTHKSDFALFHNSFSRTRKEGASSEEWYRGVALFYVAPRVVHYAVTLSTVHCTKDMVD